MTAARVLAALAVLAIGGARAEAACTLSATAVSFGVYDVFQVSPTDSTGSITYRCAPQDKNITITISQGSSATFTPRALRNGVDVLDYNLFTTAGFAEVWGDGTGGTQTYFVKNAPNNQDTVLTVYARIPAGQDARAGTYGDSVVVTLEY